MQDDLSRAQRYRALADEMRASARSAATDGGRAELLDLAAQYERLADKLGPVIN